METIIRGVLLACCLGATSATALASPFVEIQRYSDQAVEAPKLTIVSPDEAHFYVFGRSDIVGHAVFPPDAVSPRVTLVPGFIDDVAISDLEDAIFSSDGRFLYLARRTQVIVLERDASTGSLRLIQADDREAGFAVGLAITGDGRNLYSVDSTELTRYARDPVTGRVSMLERTAYTSVALWFPSVAVTPDDRSVLVSGGASMLVTYQRDLSDGSLELDQTLDLSGGPGDQALVVLDNRTVVVGHRQGFDVFRRTEASAPFERIQFVPSSDFAGPGGFLNNGEFFASPDGAHLYSSYERPEIARFSVGEDGMLTFEGVQPLLEIPGQRESLKSLRFFSDGARAVVAATRSDRYALLERDVDTGELSLAPNQIYDGAPNGTQGLADATLALSPGADRLVASSIADRQLIVFDVMENGRIFPAQTLASAPDGGNVAFDAEAGVNRFYVAAEAAILLWERDGITGLWESRQVTPFGLDPLDYRLPLYLYPSRDGRFLYVVWHLGDCGVNTYEIDANGDLTPVSQTIIPASGCFPFNLLVSMDESYLYVSAFALYALKRDPADGTLTAIDQVAPAEFSSGGLALPNGEIVLSEVSSLSVYRHGEDEKLELVKRFTDTPDGERGLPGPARNLVRLSDTRFLHLTNRAAGQHAMLALDRDGELYYAGSVSLEAFSGSGFGDPAISPDGRTLYNVSRTLNAVTVVRVEGLFSGDFEALDYGTDATP